MKKRILSTRLSLVKKTIASLDTSQRSEVVGGYSHPAYSGCTTCNPLVCPPQSIAASCPPNCATG